MTKIKLNTSMILMSIVMLTAIATWVIPAGKYDKVQQGSKKVLVEGSFRYIESSPQNIFDMLQAPMKAFGRPTTAEIMAFLLIISGAFMVIEKTGAITAAIKHASAMFVKHPSMRKLFIPIGMLLFSIGGATFGMSEETLIFIPIFIPLAISLKYDSAIGVAVPFIGAAAGFAGAFMNPFTLGISQGIAEIPLYSGFGYRLIVWSFVTAAAIVFVMLYARKIEKTPSASITYDLDKERKDELHLTDNVGERFTLHRKLVLLAFAAAMVGLVVGVLKFDWYITEIGALFFGLAITAAVLGRLKVNEATKAFYDGVRDMAEIVFLLALATSIIIIAENGNILDTILHHFAAVISNLKPVFASWAAFIMQTFINFFIPSGSGKAVLTMPILAPLSDLIGLSRQTMILAYQFGDGWGNICMPTSAVLLGAIGMAQIPFQKWFRFVMPLVAAWVMLSFIFLSVAVYINWQ